jgi:hypothetical protein
LLGPYTADRKTIVGLLDGLNTSASPAAQNQKPARAEPVPLLFSDSPFWKQQNKKTRLGLPDATTTRCTGPASGLGACASPLPYLSAPTTIFSAIHADQRLLQPPSPYEQDPYPWPALLSWHGGIPWSLLRACGQSLRLASIKKSTGLRRGTRPRLAGGVTHVPGSRHPTRRIRMRRRLPACPCQKVEWWQG